tara:strand:- start:4048 stop:5229 length:1182 start_codon:yes stop_codon:yes gene_type:complete
MKSIIEVGKNLANKIVLVRLDLNVPIENGKITDTNRIDKIVPTLDYLIKKNTKLILISHIGRPKGKVDENFSLKPVGDNLSKKLNRKIKLINKNIYQLNKSNLFEAKDYKIILLENIRFYAEEEKNDEKFGKHLASLGDLYVNEAFSCSHRPHSSISKISKYIDVYAGLLFTSEVQALNKVTKDIAKPISCIIGGSKISTKIKIIENLVSKFDNIIIVGGMANSFLKYFGQNIGKSIYEENSVEIIKKIIETAKLKNCNLIFPEDYSVGKNLNDAATNKTKEEIQDLDMILDIGPATIKKIIKLINCSKTILWNGPAGYFENENFAKGSFEITKAISKNTKEGKLYSVVGGGDTVAVINKLNLFNDFNFVSTAGGAFLEFLEGKELPGITALK